MLTPDYQKKYSKQVNVRYYKHYKNKSIIIVTLFKDIFKIHKRYLCQNYTKVYSYKQKNKFILKADYKKEIIK